jgi:hypothetical protein
MSTDFTPKDLREKAVVVKHTCTGKTYGSMRKDKALSKKVAEENGSTEKSVKASKMLIDPKYLAGMADIGGKSYAKHQSDTLPWTDKGGRILPTSNYAQYMAAQRDFREQYRIEVAKFERVYPDAIEDARQRLGPLFREIDYKPADRLFSKHPITGFYLKFCIGDPEFGIEVSQLDDGDDIRVALTSDAARLLKEQTEARCQRLITAAVTDLWGRMREPIEHLVERLDNYEVAERKSFQSAWVDNIKAIVAMVPRLNLTGDKDLDRIAAEAEHFLCRWNSDQLKSSKGAREMVRDSAAEILKKMAAYCGTVDDMDFDMEEAA